MTCGCDLRGGYRATKRDKKYLARVKAGKSIGFTMRASLKAKGLLKRANGTRRVSAKYRKQRGGGLKEDALAELVKAGYDDVNNPDKTKANKQLHIFLFNKDDKYPTNDDDKRTVNLGVFTFKRYRDGHAYRLLVWKTADSDSPAKQYEILYEYDDY